MTPRVFVLAPLAVFAVLWFLLSALIVHPGFYVAAVVVTALTVVCWVDGRGGR